jgi:hypothetical protein
VFLSFSEIRIDQDAVEEEEQKKKLTLGVAIQSVVAVGRLQRRSEVARMIRKGTDDRYIQTSSSTNHSHTKFPVCD